MSYIRCTSNPEGLYVFGSVSGYMEFYWNWYDESCSANANYEDIWGLIKLLHKDGDAFWLDHPIKYGDVKIEEVLYSFEEKREVSDEEYDKRVFDFDNPFPTELQVKLTIGDKSIYMYETTWRYLYNGLLADWKYENKQPGANRQAHKLSARQHCHTHINRGWAYYRTRRVRHYTG